MDQIAVYTPQLDQVHYTTKFLDGLLPGVRLLVAIQQPRDLDTAYSLSLLYEELGDDCAASGAITPLATAPRRSFQAPPPPLQPFKWVSKTVEEKKSAELHRSTSDDKWQGLKAYRRAKGLCFTCGEKYSREHHCKNTIQLHVVQEMIQYMQTPKDIDSTPSDSETSSPDSNLMMLSVAAMNSVVSSPKSMQIKVDIQGHQLLFLIGSGSSACFLDSHRAKLLTG